MLFKKKKGQIKIFQEKSISVACFGSYGVHHTRCRLLMRDCPLSLNDTDKMANLGTYRPTVHIHQTAGASDEYIHGNPAKIQREISAMDIFRANPLHVYVLHKYMQLRELPKGQINSSKIGNALVKTLLINSCKPSGFAFPEGNTRAWKEMSTQI